MRISVIGTLLLLLPLAQWLGPSWPGARGVVVHPKGKGPRGDPPGGPPGGPHRGPPTSTLTDTRDARDARDERLVPDPTAACRKPHRAHRLLALCRRVRREPGLLREVSRGVALATSECQHQLADHRWNCTVARKSLRKVLARDFREASLVSALMAAGVTHAVTRACSTGDLVQCGCDKDVDVVRDADAQRAGRHRPARRAARRPRVLPPSLSSSSDSSSADGDWRWGGCGDNVQFGARKSRAFLDAPYHHRHPLEAGAAGAVGAAERVLHHRHVGAGLHALVRMHNHAAGRLAVRQYMRRGCKCHGLSGSCTLRTCWWRMPAFREVGDRLRARFLAADKVVPDNDGRSFSVESSSRSPPRRRPRRQDLVFAEDSPDFCQRDARVGSLGTQGRLCNATAAGAAAGAAGPGSCQHLCCGRGFDTRVLRTRVNCNCRFIWCCKVSCSSCVERRRVHTCR